jgi:hypothetical protein
MNHHDKDPLDEFLGQWKVPDAPPHLKNAVSKVYRRKFAQRGWRWFLHGSLRIPVPFALAGLAAAVLLAFVIERNEHTVQSHAQALVEVQGRRAGEIQKVEVPVYHDRVVVRIRYRDRPRNAASMVATVQPQAQPSAGGYQFVAALNARIIRRDHEDHD